MKSSAKKVELAPYDDLFSTEESRQDAKLEKIQEIPLSELHPFKGHPFKVKDDEAMMETADSVRQYGVLVPAIARPDPEGGYELVAGHRRHRASELAEKETMPVIVRDLDDDAATIIMVDSNLQRESLLPSERAFAYKMKLEAKLLFFHIIQQYINLFAAIVVAIFIAWKKELVYRDVKQGSNEIKFVKPWVLPPVLYIHNRAWRKVYQLGKIFLCPPFCFPSFFYRYT